MGLQLTAFDGVEPVSETHPPLRFGGRHADMPDDLEPARPLMIPQTAPARQETLNTPNREQWLINVAVLMRPWFRSRGYESPLRVRLGVGALSASQGTLGVCYPGADRDGFRHITISPFIDDPVLVAAVLAHELIHAIFPPQELHGPRFRQAARALGFEGRLTQVVPGPQLAAVLQAIVRQVGPYPHRAILAA